MRPFFMIKTDRLTLRAAGPDDLDDLFAIYGDPIAMRYWSTPPHPTKERTQDNLGRLIQSGQDAVRRYGVPLYVVFEKEDAVIGLGGLHKDDEIGFILRPDYWRQGYITEAMGALIPIIFAKTNLSQLTADVDPRNIGSCKALEKLGFQETHRAKDTFFIDGEWSDSVYFALRRT